jgi:hypothetical protein
MVRGTSQAGRAEAGGGPQQPGHPGLAVGAEEGLHRRVDLGQLLVDEHVLEDQAEAPAGEHDPHQSQGERQAKGALGPEPAGQEGELALVAFMQASQGGARQLAVDGGSDSLGMLDHPPGQQDDRPNDHDQY